MTVRPVVAINRRNDKIYDNSASRRDRRSVKRYTHLLEQGDDLSGYVFFEILFERKTEEAFFRLVPCCVNTIGPGLFLQADYAIGGADGAFGRGMQWQGLSLWMTLRHEKTPWITSTYIPALAEKLFLLKELAGPLATECN